MERKRLQLGREEFRPRSKYEGESWEARERLHVRTLKNVENKLCVNNMEEARKKERNIVGINVGTDGK